MTTQTAFLVIRNGIGDSGDTPLRVFTGDDAKNRAGDFALILGDASTVDTFDVLPVPENL